MNSNIVSKGFTLAEVLITLGIIGIVSAMVLPSFVGNYQDKVRSEQDRSVKYKFTKSTDKMKSLGLIGPYPSTKAFINEFKKHYKIAKICEPNKLEACWPTKTYMDSLQKTKNVSDLSNPLMLKPAFLAYDTIGIVSADGTPFILAFDPHCESLEPEKTYLWSTVDNKPVTNSTTSCIAMMFDINGKGKPNQMGKDIKTLNINEFVDYGGVMMTEGDISYSPMSISTDEYVRFISSLSAQPCTDRECGANGDYWAGAMKKCMDMGGSLPTLSQLAMIASVMYHDTVPADSNYSGKKYEDPFNIGSSKGHWSNKTRSGYYVQVRSFGDRLSNINMGSRGKYYPALCVGK